MSSESFASKKSRSLQAMVNLPPGERQLLIKNLRVDHDRYREAVAAIRRFHLPVEGGVHDTGSLSVLAGDSRTGKSYAANQYRKQYPPIVGPDGMIFPVVYVEMPGQGGYRAILEQIATALEIKFSLRMNSSILLNAILNGLAFHDVQLLILDEFHDVFDSDRSGLLNQSRTLVRKILNLGTLNVLCIGLAETYGLMSADEQLTGRGGLTYKLLRAYEWNSEEERNLFRLLCDEIDGGLPFRRKAGLGSVNIASRLHFVTDGIVGPLKDFLFNAACLAINDESDRIELHHLVDAYDMRKPPGTSFNPFVNELIEAPVRSEKQPRDSGETFTKRRVRHAILAS